MSRRVHKKWKPWRGDSAGNTPRRWKPKNRPASIPKDELALKRARHPRPVRVADRAEGTSQRHP